MRREDFMRNIVSVEPLPDIIRLAYHKRSYKRGPQSPKRVRASCGHVVMRRRPGEKVFCEFCAEEAGFELN